MENKWKIFALTFLSWSLIHSVRTSWSSLKYILNSPPYGFSAVFLGTLDMIVLFSFAISLSLFGPKIQKAGPKKFLLRGMVGLTVIVVLLGIFLCFTVTSTSPYAILYPLVGICSSVGWPACLFILSKYFQKGMVFSVWNGCSQFGDFLALSVSYIIIEQADASPGIFLLTMAALLVGIFLLNKKFLPEIAQFKEQNIPEASPASIQLHQLVEQNVGQGFLRSQNHIQSARIQQIEPTKKPVNFITVWTLPGVPAYILSFLFVKSVNAVIVAWLIYYLSMIGMTSESRIIGLLWAVSTFLGGLIGAYINPNFNKRLFIGALLASSILFIFLEEVHLYPNDFEVIVLVIACGLIFGGPFTLMSTSIPLLLSQKPAIKEYPGAKAAIISAMDGYAIFFSGISLLIIPEIGVIDLHWIASLYCAIAAIILLYEEIKERNNNQQQNNDGSTDRPGATQKSIRQGKKSQMGRSVRRISKQTKQSRVPYSQHKIEQEILDKGQVRSDRRRLRRRQIQKQKQNLSMQYKRKNDQSSEQMREHEKIEITDQPPRPQGSENMLLREKYFKVEEPQPKKIEIEEHPIQTGKPFVEDHRPSPIALSVQQKQAKKSQQRQKNEEEEVEEYIELDNKVSQLPQQQQDKQPEQKQADKQSI